MPGQQHPADGLRLDAALAALNDQISQLATEAAASTPDGLLLLKEKLLVLQSVQDRLFVQQKDFRDRVERDISRQTTEALPPFGQRPWTPEQSARIASDLAMPLPADLVRVLKKGGADIHYVEAGEAIKAADRIFGFDGWSCHILSLAQTSQQQQQSDWIEYHCMLKVTLKDGTSVTEQGTGVAPTKLRENAADLASKAAVSDAIKRCLAHFGPALGLGLKCSDDRAQIKFEMAFSQSQHSNKRPHSSSASYAPNNAPTPNPHSKRATPPLPSFASASAAAAAATYMPAAVTRTMMTVTTQQTTTATLSPGGKPFAAAAAATTTASSEFGDPDELEKVMCAAEERHKKIL